MVCNQGGKIVMTNHGFIQDTDKDKMLIKKSMLMNGLKS